MQIHFFGMYLKWKSWRITQLVSDATLPSGEFEKTSEGKKNAEESNFFGLSGLFVVMSVNHCSELLPRFQEGDFYSTKNAHGFPKTCHPEDEEATMWYQIPITLGGK